MSKFSHVLSNALIYGAGAVSTKLVGFILLPIYTSHLNTNQYGQLAILEITSQAIISLFGISLYRALNRWYWDKNYLKHQKSIFFSGLALLAIIVIFLSFIIYFFSENIAFLLLGSAQLGELVLFMGLTAGLQIIIHFILSLMRIQEKPVLYSISNLIKLIITLALTILFIVKLDKGILGIYQAQILGQGLFFLISLRYILTNISFRFNWHVLKGMLKYSYPLAIAGVSGIVLSMTDRYFLRFLTDFSDVGVYSLGFKVANTTKVFLVSSLQLAIGPIIYKMMDHENRYIFYSKIMKHFSFLVMFSVLAISIFSKEIIFILAKDQPSYWKASTIIPIISFSIFFGMLKDVATTGINISKKTKVLAGVLVLIATINMVLNFLFIPLWESNGAALATLISQIIFFIIIYISSQKVYFIPYDLKKIIFLIFTSLILFLVSFLVSIEDTYISMIFKLGILLAFPVLLYFQNFFTKDEIRWTVEWMRKISIHFK